MSEENLPGGSQAVSRIDGTRIRAIRERKELTQLYVATVVGVTTDTISRWENRRYPTIKQENALKLAEVLEVELSEILDTESEPSPPADDEAPAPDENERKTKKSIPVMVIILMAVAVGTLVAAFFLKPQKIDTTGSPLITAKRILPPHVAPGQLFPVIIRVNISTPGVYSMIVREAVPLDCLIVKGLPSFANLDGKNGVLKWIGRAADQTSFSYLARSRKSVADGKMLSFSGAATLKKDGASSRIPITGDNSVTIKKLHWADTNGDHRIDDEEILAVYDQLEAMTELGSDDFQSGVEDIWAASGYRWDETTESFAVVP